MLRPLLKRLIARTYHVYRSVRPKPEAPPVTPIVVTPPPDLAHPTPQPAPVLPSEVPPPPAPIHFHAESTPNPNAMKFIGSRKVVPSGTLSFTSADKAKAHPLGAALFALDGVRIVFAVGDFVTITKAASASWEALEPQALAALSQVLGPASG